MSKPDTWMPLFIGDYLGDTTRFNATQHGAYLLLIMDYWRNGPPPDDDDVLATAARCKPAEWKRIRPSIAAKFEVQDGVWHHKRIDLELGNATERSSKSEEKARRGASAKWGGDPTAERGRELRSTRMSEARAKGTHTAAQWDAMKAWHAHTCVRCHATNVEIVRDHIIPVYQGGSDAIENIQPMCRPCNAAKGPERTDLRKEGWQNVCLVAFQAGNECLPDACPSPSPLPPPSGVEEGASLPLSGLPPDVLPPRRPKVNGELKAERLTQMRRDAVEIISFLNERARKKFEPVKANIDLIVARLRDGATVDQVRAVIEQQCIEWNANPEMGKYLRPETLFNATKYAGYVGHLGDDPQNGTPRWD